MKRLFVSFMVLLMVMFLAACGSDSSDNKASSDMDVNSSTTDTTDTTESSTEESGAVDVTSSRETSKDSTSEPTSVVSEKRSDGYTEQVQQQIRSGQLTAGLWDDNENFDFFMDLLNDNQWYSMKEYWGFINWQRFEFNVVNKQGQALVNALIELHDDQGQVIYTGRSDNEGYAVIYPFLDKTFIDEPKVQARITYNQNIYEIVDMNQNHDFFKVTLDEKARGVSDVDIMFVVDTTGSMEDELMYLQVELTDVIRRVDNSNLDIMLSGNYYRDHYDDYLIHSHPFTREVKDVVKIMNQEYAKGGGDYPEAVVEALDDAINRHNWRESAEAKLLFLVLDAPPHYNDNNLDQLQLLVQKANALGIRIIPVASSGVDKKTEFLLRFLDTSTNGTYVFLTDHSGIGNSHITPTIGHYKVEQLNDLLVDVINSYIR